MQRRKWASFAVAVCARVRFMSWITAKSLSGNVAQTNDRNINGCEMRLKDHKRHEIKAGKVKATVYGSLNRLSCQTTTILAQNTRLSTPSASAFGARWDASRWWTFERAIYCAWATSGWKIYENYEMFWLDLRKVDFKCGMRFFWKGVWYGLVFTWILMKIFYKVSEWPQ